jgi:hypothetical protein
MPLRLDELRASGVAATVTDRVPGHPNRAIKDAAAAVLARWEGRSVPAAPGPARPVQPQGPALPRLSCVAAPAESASCQPSSYLYVPPKGVCTTWYLCHGYSAPSCKEAQPEYSYSGSKMDWKCSY